MDTKACLDGMHVTFTIHEQRERRVEMGSRKAFDWKGNGCVERRGGGVKEGKELNVMEVMDGIMERQQTSSCNGLTTYSTSLID